MSKEIEELKLQMTCLKEEELLKKLNSSYYRQVAINLAIEELLRRNISSGSIVDEFSLLSLENKLTSLSNKGTITPSKGRSVWAWITGLILFSNVVRIISYAFADFPDNPAQYVGDIQTAIISGLLILPLGIALFEIRERHLMLYARLEILFGVFSGIYTIGERTHWGAVKDSGTINLATWTALAASLYIVVRGLDNRKKAIMKLEKENKEKEEESIKTEDARHGAEMEKMKECLKQA